MPQVLTIAMFVLLRIGNYKLQRQSGFEWHNIEASRKCNENSSL
jgi:hypothetical protein